MHRFMVSFGILLLLVACNKPAPEAEAPKSFAMPTIEGRSFDDAQNICAQWDLQLAVIDQQYNWQKPENTVLRQWPQPGEQILPGHTAVVIASTKPAKVRTPNLHGCTLQQAESRLREAGLRLAPRMVYRYNSAVPRDRVLDYDPGREVYAGSEVEIVLSKGDVPNRTSDGGEVNTLRMGK